MRRNTESRFLPERAKVKSIATSAEVRDAILKMKKTLQDKYGTDFSFSVNGNGHKIAASNFVDGEIDPIATP